MGFLFDLFINLFLRKINAPYYWAANSFLLTEFILISYYYKNEIFSNNKLFYLITGILSVAFVVTTFINGIEQLNGTYAALFFSPLICIYSIAGFYSILKKQETLFLWESSFFWANVAFIIFFTGNFFVFLFSNYMLQNGIGENYAAKYISHDTLNIVLNITLAVSLFVKYRTSEPAGQSK